VASGVQLPAGPHPEILLDPIYEYVIIKVHMLKVAKETAMKSGKSLPRERFFVLPN